MSIPKSTFHHGLLSVEILNRLRRHPASARQLAAEMNRRAATVSKACRRLHRDGFIRRDRQRWIFVTNAGTLVDYRHSWTVAEAQRVFEGSMCQPVSYVDPNDLTVLGVTRRMFDEARHYLEHHDPDFVDACDRDRDELIALFTAIRTAAAHDVGTFVRIVARLINQHGDVVGRLVPPLEVVPKPLVFTASDECGWLDWIAHGQEPNPMPSTFRYPGPPPKPARDERLLMVARNVLADPEAYDETVATWLVRMCVAISHPTIALHWWVHQQLTAASTQQGIEPVELLARLNAGMTALSQEPATTEPMEQES